MSATGQCKQDTAPRAFNTCHTRNFSCARGSKFNDIWIVFVLTVIPSQPCFVALCLTHLFPYHSLHNVLHLHRVRRLPLRCSILLRVHPLPRGLNESNAYVDKSDGDFTDETKSATLLRAYVIKARVEQLAWYDKFEAYEEVTDETCMSRTRCKPISCRWKDMNKDDVCRVKSNREGPTATSQEHHQELSYDT